jgi:hypothetical protein
MQHVAWLDEIILERARREHLSFLIVEMEIKQQIQVQGAIHKLEGKTRTDSELENPGIVKVRMKDA